MTEEPGGLQSMKLRRVEHDQSDWAHAYVHTHVKYKPNQVTFIEMSLRPRAYAKEGWPSDDWIEEVSLLLSHSNHHESQEDQKELTGELLFPKTWPPYEILKLQRNKDLSSFWEPFVAGSSHN